MLMKQTGKMEMFNFCFDLNQKNTVDKTDCHNIRYAMDGNEYPVKIILLKTTMKNELDMYSKMDFQCILFIKRTA